jgi:hypothetical protein
MAKSLADRVVALEGHVGSKTIQEQFREQAELIDRLFEYRFQELDKSGLRASRASRRTWRSFARASLFS